MFIVLLMFAFLTPSPKACQRLVGGELERCLALNLGAEEQRLTKRENQVRDRLQGLIVSSFDLAAAEWRRYRDVECRCAQSSQIRYANPAAAELECRIELTKARMASLNKIYR